MRANKNHIEMKVFLSYIIQKGEVNQRKYIDSQNLEGLYLRKLYSKPVLTNPHYARI